MPNKPSPWRASAPATGYAADFSVVVDRSEMGAFAHFLWERPVLSRVRTLKTPEELLALRSTLPAEVMYTVQQNAACEADYKRETVASFRAEKVGDLFSLYLMHESSGDVRCVCRFTVNVALDLNALVEIALDKFRADLRHNAKVSDGGESNGR